MEPDAAVGLEGTAKLLPLQRVDDLESNDETESTGDKDQVSTVFSLSLDSVTVSCDHSQNQDEGCSRLDKPLHHYGAVSSKIGEAAACWLARWAQDLLAYEERRANIVSDPPANENTPSLSIGAVPNILCRGGLDATWISRLVASDMLFVKGENERYDFAKRVVELRRRDGEDDQEEIIWAQMFSHGIYYANMVCIRRLFFAFAHYAFVVDGGVNSDLPRYIAHDWASVCPTDRPSSGKLESICDTASCHCETTRVNNGHGEYRHN